MTTPTPDQPQGSLLPSIKWTTLMSGTALGAALGRLLKARYGWDIDPVFLDLAGLILAGIAAYLVPELNPSRSAVQAIEVEEIVAEAEAEHPPVPGVTERYSRGHDLW